MVKIHPDGYLLRAQAVFRVDGPEPRMLHVEKLDCHLPARDAVASLYDKAVASLSEFLAQFVLFGELRHNSIVFREP